MRKFVRVLFGVALLLAVGSIATYSLGRAYEISKLPPDFPDKDIAGLEWEFAGIYIFASAALLALVAATLWLIERVSKAKGPNAGNL
jgi:hypothetical protein